MSERLTIDEITNLDVLLVPTQAALPSSLGDVVYCSMIKELLAVIATSNDDGRVPVVCMTDVKVLDIINKSSELIPVSAAVLVDVPSGDYDVLFNNYSHMMSRLSLIELQRSVTATDREANKLAQTGGEKDKDDDMLSKVAKKASEISARSKARLSPSLPPVDTASILAIADESDSEDDS